MMCLKLVFNFQKIKLKILNMFIMDVLKLILNFNKNINIVYIYVMEVLKILF